MPSDQDPSFDSEYTGEVPTTSPPPAGERPLQPLEKQLDPKQYGTGKPRRVVIRGKISRD
jgi:hypothetical protein